MTESRKPFREPTLEELDAEARTRQMPISNGKPRRLITREEHTVDMVVCGICMFACGFLAAAILLAVVS